MDMKRCFVLFICFVVSTMMSVQVQAQTQQGVVKTRGRMVNGKLVPGVGLPGATVEIEDRQAVVVKNKDGKFSFPVREKKYKVKNVQKQDYNLVDVEACRSYKYSEEPLYLVMEKPAQQRSDLIAAERKIRHNLQRQLQQKEEEIENIKNASRQEKDSLIEILYQHQTDNEKLIADMAKRYSTLDYDQLDDFYRQVNSYIENGELTRADSLLRTRGNIKEQIDAELKKRDELQDLKAQLTKAIAANAANIGELSQRCYVYIQEFMIAHQLDSASVYILLYAKIDTTDADRQLRVGKYISTYEANIPLAMEYYQLAERHSKDSIDYRNLYNNVGALYYETGRYSQSIEYFEKALSFISETELETDERVPNIYSNLASAYADCGKVEKALSLFDKALKYSRTIFGENHIQTAYIYHQIGSLYKNIGDDDKSLENTKKAVEIAEGLPGDHSDLLVSCYNNLGNLYGRYKDYEQAKAYMEKSIDLKKEIFGEKHPDIGVSYMNLGVIYYRMGGIDQAIEQYYKAERQLQANDSLHFRLIDVYINLGTAYDEKGEKTKALQMYEKGEKVVEHVCDDKDQDAYLFLPYIYDMLAQLADSSDLYKQRFIHYLDDKAILAVVPEGVGSPAEKIGMKGKYYVLKYNDWNINSPIMFFNYIFKVSEQPKDVVFMQGDEVVTQHFEKKVGVNFILRYVSSDQQQKLREAMRNVKTKKK